VAETERLRGNAWGFDFGWALVHAEKSKRSTPKPFVAVRWQVLNPENLSGQAVQFSHAILLMLMIMIGVQGLTHE
jgi:hypothetical protein